MSSVLRQAVQMMWITGVIVSAVGFHRVRYLNYSHLNLNHNKLTQSGLWPLQISFHSACRTWICLHYWWIVLLQKHVFCSADNEAASSSILFCFSFEKQIQVQFKKTYSTVDKLNLQFVKCLVRFCQTCIGIEYTGLLSQFKAALYFPGRQWMHPSSHLILILLITCSCAWLYLAPQYSPASSQISCCLLLSPPLIFSDTYKDWSFLNTFYCHFYHYSNKNHKILIYDVHIVCPWFQPTLILCPTNLNDFPSAEYDLLESHNHISLQ